MAGKRTGIEKKLKSVQNRRYKTYKIFPFHHVLFYSCLSVCTRDRLTDYLIKEFLNEDIKDIHHLSKAELIDYMINDIKDEQLSSLAHVHNSNRIEELIKCYQAQGLIWNDVRLHLQTHIDISTLELISKLSNQTETIGEVLEISIEYYLSKVSEAHYQVIKLAFENNLLEQKNNPS